MTTEKFRNSKYQSIKYLDFSSARDFVRKLNLKSASEWKKYSINDKPYNIPSTPSRYYKNYGWVSWMDWLGTNNNQGGDRKYKVNDNYFKHWSHNMAYVLGFWWADGYMYEKNNVFSITQHKNDKYILEDILKEMDSDASIRKHYWNNYCFRISSKEIVKDLKLLGGHQKKSKTIDFPKGIPNEFLPDFIRGYFDGDGCITFQKNEKSYVSTFVSASKFFIYSLHNELKRSIRDFKGNIGHYGSIFVISIGVNDTRRLREYMYSSISNKNILHLKRKYDKFILSGKINIASFDRIFGSYDEAKKFVREKGISTLEEWKKYKKDNKIDFFPSNLDNYYKYKGWINCSSFFETGIWDFYKAREYVRSLKLNGTKAWRKYAAGDRIRNIPSNPWSVYKEWNGMKDWMGE